MRAEVITLESVKESCDGAARCQESALKFGLEVTKRKAQTPNTYFSYFARNKIPVFQHSRYSRTENVMACFASHHSVWSGVTDEPCIVLEHDAIFVNEIPWSRVQEFYRTADVINIGKPSYGKFMEPGTARVARHFSKKGYLGGAHGYVVTPRGAKKLCAQARERPEPVDLFLSTKHLDIYETYPWPVECHDSFTTVQTRNGCKAKHKYDDEYKIIDIVNGDSNNPG